MSQEFFIEELRWIPHSLLGGGEKRRINGLGVCECYMSMSGAQTLRRAASREPAGFVTLQMGGCSVATCVRRSLLLEQNHSKELMPRNSVSFRVQSMKTQQLLTLSIPRVAGPIEQLASNRSCLNAVSFQFQSVETQQLLTLNMPRVAGPIEQLASNRSCLNAVSFQFQSVETQQLLTLNMPRVAGPIEQLASNRSFASVALDKATP